MREFFLFLFLALLRWRESDIQDTFFPVCAFDRKQLSCCAFRIWKAAMLSTQDLNALAVHPLHQHALSHVRTRSHTCAHAHTAAVTSNGAQMKPRKVDTTQEKQHNSPAQVRSGVGRRSRKSQRLKSSSLLLKAAAWPFPAGRNFRDSGVISLKSVVDELRLSVGPSSGVKGHVLSGTAARLPITAQTR